jgi:hypothetical protein
MKSARKRRNRWRELPAEPPVRRLEQDGAHSSEALRRRVMALAQERNIPPADFKKLMYKRINTQDVMVFCEKHKVNYDWLLAGDLRGLRTMTQEAKADQANISEAQRKEIISLFCALSPHHKTIALGWIQELIAKNT